MDWDDLQPQKAAKVVTLGETLETLSVAELEGRIAALEEEVGRVEAELNKKRAHEAAANALFKK